MSVEVGVPGKTIHYLNLHKEGTTSGTFCEVDENWNGKILDKQSDYLVAISRFEVPMNRVPINRALKNAVEIYRYFDQSIHDKFKHIPAGREGEDDFKLAISEADFADPKVAAAIHSQKLNLRVPDHISYLQKFTYDQLRVRSNAFNKPFDAHPIQATTPLAKRGYNNPEVMIGAQKEFMAGNADFIRVDPANASNVVTIPDNDIAINNAARNVTSDEMDNYLHNAEQLDVLNLTKRNPIDLPPCHTIFELLSHLNTSIRDRLLAQDDTFLDNFDYYNNITAFGNSETQYINTNATAANPLRYNTFGTGTINDFDDQSDDPIANVFIRMSGDYKFSVMMNHHFAQTYYIKLHPELFRMFQFQQSSVSDLKDDDFFEVDGEKKIRYNRAHLRGRRFMGDRLSGGDRRVFASLRRRDHKKEYRTHVRNVHFLQPLDSHVGRLTAANREFLNGRTSSTYPQGSMNVGNEVATVTQQFVQLLKVFTAPVSASDSATRVKSIVFQSSLPTRSESSSGASYQHFLTDFTLPTASNFSFNANSLTTDTVVENMAQEVVYFSANPSSGRLLMLTDPSPLYELKLKVLAKCWNFETESFYFEDIPLPPGATFTCKLVFVSKNDIHARQGLDRIQGGT